MIQWKIARLQLTQKILLWYNLHASLTTNINYTNVFRTQYMVHVPIIIIMIIALNWNQQNSSRLTYRVVKVTNTSQTAWPVLKNCCKNHANTEYILDVVASGPSSGGSSDIASGKGQTFHVLLHRECSR